VFEQGSRSSSGYPTRTVFSLRAQEAIRRRGTHAEQLMAARLREMQMSMLLKCFDESGEERDQPLGTHLISRFPCQEQGLLDCWSVVWETCLLAARFRLPWMIEQLNGVFTHIAGDGNEFIEQEDFVCARCLLIAGSHLLNQFPPCLIAQC